MKSEVGEDPTLIFKVDLKNLDMIENRLLLYKNIPIGSLNKQPYYRINFLVDEWMEDIKRRKAEEERRRAEIEAKQRKMERKYNRK